MACLVVIAVDSVAKKAGPLSYIALLLVTWLAAISFYRSNWIYPASALGLILMSGKSKTRLSNIAKIALIFSPFVIIAISFLEEFYNSSESFKIQSILKTQDLIMYFQGYSALNESEGLFITPATGRVAFR